MTEIHKQYRQALTPRELYTERIKTLTEEIRQLNRHNRLVVVLELSAIALAVGCVVAYTMWSNVAALVVAVLFIAAYVAIRWRDSRNSRMAEEKESLRSVYQKELNYLDGDFSGFASGEQYVNPRHAFSLDLDIFGPQSLLTIGEIETRREAIRELSERELLRTAFMAQGRGRQIDTADILEALRAVRQMQMPRLAAHRLIHLAAVGSILVFYGLLAAAVLGPLSGTLPMLWVLLQMLAVYLLFGRTLKRINQSINIILPRLSTYVNMIMLSRRAGRAEVVPIAEGHHQCPRPAQRGMGAHLQRPLPGRLLHRAPIPALARPLHGAY